MKKGKVALSIVLAVAVIAIGVVLVNSANKVSAEIDRATMVTEYQGVCEIAGTKYSVCPELLEALIEDGDLLEPDTTQAKAEEELDDFCETLLGYECDDAYDALNEFNGNSDSNFADRILSRSAELERIHGK